MRFYRNGDQHTRQSDTRIVYTLHAQGCVDIDAEFTPHNENLRRAGIQVGLNRELQRIDYYAYGPLENYSDRRDGVLLGRYQTTPASSMERYIKPQSTGNREGLREATFTDFDGRGVKIQTEGEVSFSALPYTEQDLMNAQHTWELQPQPFTVLHLDAAYRGGRPGHDLPVSLQLRGTFSVSSRGSLISSYFVIILGNETGVKGIFCIVEI